MQENGNELFVCLTSDSYTDFVFALREKADRASTKSEAFSLRRAAGMLANHFATDFLEGGISTRGIDKHNLVPVSAIADVELRNKSIAIDLLLVCSDGCAYSMQEVRGIHQIFSPQELAERSKKARRNENEHS